MFTKFGTAVVLFNIINRSQHNQNFLFAELEWRHENSLTELSGKQRIDSGTHVSNKCSLLAPTWTLCKLRCFLYVGFCLVCDHICNAWAVVQCSARNDFTAASHGFWQSSTLVKFKPFHQSTVNFVQLAVTSNTLNLFEICALGIARHLLRILRHVSFMLNKNFKLSAKDD